MKKTNFIALALSASMLLVACKPAEISKQEAAKRFENINNAFQAVETIDALTITNSFSESSTKNGETKSASGAATIAANVEKLYTHASATEDGKLVEDAYAYLKDNKFYLVDAVEETYSEIDATNVIDKVKAQINTEALTELIDSFKEFANSVADYLKITANDFTAALEQTFGKEIKFDKNLFDLKFYSSGEGNLLIENSIDYSLSVEIASQKIGSSGTTFGSVEFKGNMPTRLTTETTVNTTSKIANVETNLTQTAKEEIEINYNAKVTYPDISGFTKEEAQRS